jgi:hypothetical protein
LWASVAVQLGAAFLWIWSTKAKVKAEQVVEEWRRQGNSGTPALITDDDDNEVTATAARQSQISGWAAVATALGIALQAVALALSSQG